tara:strand:- start:228 stop:644 length:417 start_codon:yes stop_codon:yes gene_type:complete
MCNGGGGRTTIQMPDTSAYDSQLDTQIMLMQQQQNNSSTLLQNSLNQSQLDNQNLLSSIKDFKLSAAKDVSANAARMSALIGAPPPDKTAKAPVVGRDRERSKNKKKGKKSLRVDKVQKKKTSTKKSSGTGLNSTLTV